MANEQVVEEEVMEQISLDDVDPAPEETTPAADPAEPAVEDTPPVEEVAEVIEETIEEIEPPEEPPVVEDRLDRIERLMEQITQTVGVGNLDDSELGQSIAGIRAGAGRAKAAPKAEPAESSVAVRRDIKSLITKSVHDRVLESPEGLGDLMQAVYDQSLLDAKENMMRDVVGIVDPIVSEKFTIKNLTDDLFREHPSLFKVRKQVGRIARDIHVNNPDMGMDEVFTSLRSEIKENYSNWLEEDEASTTSAVKKKKLGRPAIPTKPKKRTAVPPKMTGLQAEMQKMSDAGPSDFE